MNALFVYLLESTVCLGVFYLFYLAVLYRQPSFRYNRVYLLAASALGWILPWLEIPLGFSDARSSAGQGTGYWLLAPAQVGEAADSTLTVTQGLGIMYGLGVLVVLVIYGKRFYRLYRAVQASSLQLVPHRRYRLLYTNGAFPTSSFFRYLFWDNTQPMTVAETFQIMSHEETHIRQGHSYDVLYITLLKIIAWFHPLVYLYERALTQTHEYAADAGVLKRATVDPKEYVRLLSKHMLISRNMMPVNHFFYPSQTLNRIRMIYSHPRRVPWYHYVMIIPVFTSLFFTFSCQPEEEELTQQTVAQSYEEVQQFIEQVNLQIKSIQEQYYPTMQAYKEAVNNYSRQHAGALPSELKLLRGKASSAELDRLNELIRRRDQLQEQLAYLPDADGVYTTVANRPEPTEGVENFYQFIVANMKYPIQARRRGTEGKVYVQLVVNEYGELTDIEVLKGIGEGCDQEAMRVVQASPGWKPGTTAEGKPVDVRMVLPITFALNHEEN